jgi:hypothetical protein
MGLGSIRTSVLGTPRLQEAAWKAMLFTGRAATLPLEAVHQVARLLLLAVSQKF